MKHQSVRPTDPVERIVHVYGNLLFRMCFVMLGNEADAEDALQETIIKYMRKAPTFANEDHEKAWLITTAKNQCRDMMRFKRRHPQVDLEVLQGLSIPESDSSILEALMSLPEKFRLVLTLYYVEDYPINDIAQIIGKSPSAVKMRLQKGRKLLKEAYRKEFL